MIREYGKRGERRSKIEEYYNRNYKNKTTAEIIDFMGGNTLANQFDSKLISDDEIGEIGFSFVDYLMPVVRDKNGDAVKNEDGRYTLEMDKIEQRMGEYADYALQLQIEVVKEFKRQLSLIPEEAGDKDFRNKIAMYRTQQTEPCHKYVAAVTIGVYAVQNQRGDAFNYKYQNKFLEVLSSRVSDYLETLSETEKDYFKLGNDALEVAPKLLKNTPPEKVGLNEDELKAASRKAHRNLMEKVDLNWASDETMKSKPRYMSEQLSSDKNSRYGRYYMTLDEDGKKGFILDGMIEKGNLSIYKESGDQVSVDCLSKKEKEVFGKACNVYFSPIKENGEPDKEQFIRRVDAIRDEIARLYREHADFIEKKPNFAGILQNDEDPDMRRQAAKYISPHYMKIEAYKKEMREIFGSKKISKDLKRYYISQKTGTEPGKDAKKEAVDEAIRTAFEKDIGDSIQEIKHQLLESGEEKPFSENEREALNKRANSETIRMLEGYRSNKPWLQTGRDVNLDNLKKMDNLYKQFKDADRLIYVNSEEYTELKNRLRDAAHMYRKVTKEGRELLPEERAEMESAFDDISDAALKYIDGKEKKERETAHGQSRYEIAFAALGVASRGAALEKIELHNIEHILRESKTLSIDELMARGDRTVKEQKTYEKSSRNKAKKKQQKATMNL